MNTKYEARRRAWTKYNRSAKKKKCNERYRTTHKEQCSAWSLEWQRKNRKRVNELARIRNSTPSGKALRSASHRRYALKNRIKRLAKDAIHNSIKAGKMIRKPCFVCGNVKSEGHHPDYSKPLEVIWLCKEHHAEVHLK